MDETKYRAHGMKILRSIILGLVILFIAGISVSATTEPDKPTLVYPGNDSSITETTTNLLVSVSDPDGDILTVQFYDSNTGTLLATKTVHGQGKAGTTWKLSHDTTYRWYCKVTDGTSTVQSDTWQFTCKAATKSEKRNDVYIDPDAGEGWVDVTNTTSVLLMAVEPFTRAMGSWFYAIFVLTTVGLMYLKTQRVFLPASMLIVFGIVMRALLPAEIYSVAYGLIALGFTGIVYVIFTKRQ